MFVHKFIAGRKGAGKALLLLHGTGGDENDLIPLSGKIAPGFAVLSVRGKVKEGTANRFFRRFGDSSFDLADLLMRTDELADFVEKARKDYDLGRVYALGYSNGANMAATILLLRPRTIDGAVLFRPQVPLEPSVLPDLRGKKVFISSGRADGMVRPEQAGALEALLRKSGADVTMNWAEAGHGITGVEIRKAREWMTKSIPE